MTDHASEQAMELEALEAILMDDLEVFDETNPDDWDAVGNTYMVLIDPTEEGEEAEGDEKLMELLFAHTAAYPDTPPSLRLRSVRGLSDADVAAGLAHLQRHVQENLGMAMIFTLITEAKEWLRTQVAISTQESPEQERKRLEAEEEARRQDARRHGTPFTVERFQEWRKNFEKEAAAAKERDQAERAARDPERALRVTGKAFFLSHMQKDTSYVGGEERGLSDDEEDYLDAEDSGRVGAGSAGADGDDDDDEFDFDDGDDDDDEEDEEAILGMAGGAAK